MWCSLHSPFAFGAVPSAQWGFPTDSFSAYVQPVDPKMIGLSALEQDSRVARLQDERLSPGVGLPPMPTDYHSFVEAFSQGPLRDSLPQAYHTALLDPIIEFANRNPMEFNAILATDTRTRPRTQQEANRQAQKMILTDIYQAVAQNIFPETRRASDAFQEIASDTYDGYLARGRDHGVKAPDDQILPPLVKWGSEGGPYTFGIDGLKQLFGPGMATSIVVLPLSHTSGALAGYPTLGHEVAGHDVLMADRGLLDEIRTVSSNAVQASSEVGAWRYYLASYWGYKGPEGMRMNETASDILGALRYGPAAAISLFAYFRGYFQRDGKLSVEGSYDGHMGPHPISIVRGMVLAEVVRRSSFPDAAHWANLFEQEVNKDLAGRSIRVWHQSSWWGRYSYTVPAQAFAASAKAIARAVTETPLRSLESVPLRRFCDWTVRDEQTCQALQQALRVGQPLPQEYATGGFFANHAVAAATREAAQGTLPVQTAFQRMQEYLEQMHYANPTWAPVLGTRNVALLS